MTTDPKQNTPVAPTPKHVLSLLQNIGGYVSLAINLGEALYPIVKGVVTEIKQISTGGATVTYQVLLQTDGAELDDVIKLSTDDLNAVNAELTKLGLPTIPLPPQPTT